MAEGCTMTSKICLIVLGLIFWAAAAGLFFIGGWVFSTYHHFDEFTRANLTLIPAGFLICVGVIMFILGIVGCIAAFKENKCLLALFFSILIVILTVEIAAGALAYVFRDDMRKAVEDGVEDAVNKYNGTQKDQIDYLQGELHCCGINNSTDWLTSESWSTYHPDIVPKSCCINASDCLAKDRKPGSDTIYNKGCVSDLVDKFLVNLVYITSIAIAFAVIQILGMISSCVLFCRSQEVRYEVLGGPNSGLRV